MVFWLLDVQTPSKKLERGSGSWWFGLPDAHVFFAIGLCWGAGAVLSDALVC